MNRFKIGLALTGLMIAGCGGAVRPAAKGTEAPAAVIAAKPEAPKVRVYETVGLPTNLSYEQFRDFNAHFPSIEDEYVNASPDEVILWVNPVGLENPVLATVVGDWQWVGHPFASPTLSTERYSSEGHWDLREIETQRGNEPPQFFALKDWKRTEEWFPITVPHGERVKVRFNLGYDLTDTVCPLETVTQVFRFIPGVYGDFVQETLTSSWSFDGFLIKGGFQRRYRTTVPALGSDADEVKQGIEANPAEARHSVGYSDLITSYFGGSRKQIENGVTAAPPLRCQGHVPLPPMITH